MALSWEVCRLRPSSASLTVADNKVDTKENRTWSVEYLVIAHGVTDPFQVSEIMAMRANGVPQLKKNVYVDPDGTVFPFFSCKSKNCTRNTDNPFVFNITCEYTDPDGEDGEDLQADPEDYSPKLTWTIKVRKKTAWSDVAGKSYILPTGSLHKTPLIIEYPCLVARVSQIENSFSRTTLKERMLKTNTEVWQGMSAGQALVTDINYSEIQVPVIGGVATAYRVNYTIEENDLTIKGMKGEGADGDEKRTVIDNEINWKVARPLTDTKVVTTDANGNDVVKVANQLNRTVTNVHLDKEGELLLWPGSAIADWNTHPPAIQTYRVYEEDSFNYLRV